MRTIGKIFLFLVLVLSVPSCGGKRSRPAILDPQKCGVTTLRLQDTVRGRPLITEVWYPVDETAVAQPVKGMWVRCPEARNAPIAKSAEKYPLIIMSHGNGGDRLNNAWIAEILASNGYIVAAMDHHGNTWNNQIAECFVKIWERPKDVSFVIDQMLQNSPFCEYINSEKIGFIGYSLGGHTGIWVAGGMIADFGRPAFEAIPPDQIPTIVTPDLLSSIDYSPATKSYKDARVSAFFLMAPALGGLFDPISLQTIQAPIYIVASEGDDLVPWELNAKLLGNKIKKTALTLISGPANHYVFLNEVTKGGKMMLDRKLSQDPPSVDRKKIHHDIGMAAIQFFNSNLKN